MEEIGIGPIWMRLMKLAAGCRQAKEIRVALGVETQHQLSQERENRCCARMMGEPEIGLSAAEMAAGSPPPGLGAKVRADCPPPGQRTEAQGMAARRRAGSERSRGLLPAPV